MSIKESDIQREIMQWLKAKNIFHFRCPNLTIRKRRNIVKRGVADIIGIHNGRFMAIEVKMPGGVLSEEQKDFHEAVYKEGGISIIAYSLQDVIDILD